MNILPKKRWHVRTKENIARVRKDEAEAAEKEKESQRRILLAEKEARTAALREKARQRFTDEVPEDSDKKPSSSSDRHVNFFEDIEQGIKDYGVNLEHEKEKKEEKEKYEKSIGYLTYLGQNTVEATGEISWYNKVPERFSRPDENEKTAKIQRKKELSDPLKDMCKYLQMKEGKTGSKSLNSSAVVVTPAASTCKRKNSDEEDQSRDGSKKARKELRGKEKLWRKRKKEKRRHGKHKKKGKRRHRKDTSASEEDSSDSADSREERRANLERLRLERLKRESVEAEKARAVIAKARGEPIEEDKEKKSDSDPLFPLQKYNSQFNPHLARQNFSKADPFSV